jgi:CBS domain containing-hemolysin-like protein
VILSLNIFVVLLPVFLNGFFVAAEFAFVSVRRARAAASEDRAAADAVAHLIALACAPAPAALV